MPSEQTISSIWLQGDPLKTPHYLIFDCGCMNRHAKGWILCQYHEGFDEAVARADELQALIDAWANSPGIAFVSAADALYDAATKKEDR